VREIWGLEFDIFLFAWSFPSSALLTVAAWFVSSLLLWQSGLIMQAINIPGSFDWLLVYVNFGGNLNVSASEFLVPYNDSFPSGQEVLTG
jgi:hypothetical protein